jgi:hypothetical protein
VFFALSYFSTHFNPLFDLIFGVYHFCVSHSDIEDTFNLQKVWIGGIEVFAADNS